MRPAICVAFLAAAAWLLSGCPRQHEAEVAPPKIELIPLARLLADPRHGPGVQRELSRLLEGFPQQDVRQTETVVLSPAGFLCALRFTAGQPDQQVVIQSTRFRRIQFSTGAARNEEIHTLLMHWTDEAGVSRCPEPLVRWTDVAGLSNGGIARVAERQTLIATSCTYPYVAPDSGRNQLVRTADGERMAARLSPIDVVGPTALCDLRFACDLRTRDAAVTLKGAGLEVTVSNRPDEPPPATPPPATQPAEPASRPAE
jgi:hypothetical protein